MGKIKQIIAQYGNTLENTYPVTLAEAVMYYKDGKLSSLKEYLDELKVEATGEYLPAIKSPDFWGYETYKVDPVVLFESSVFFGEYITEKYDNAVIPGDYSVAARNYIGEYYDVIKKVGNSIGWSGFRYDGLFQFVDGWNFNYSFPLISSNTDDIDYRDRTLATTVVLLNPDTEKLGSDVHGRYYSWNSNEEGSKDMLWGVKCLNYKYNTSSKKWEAENNDYIDIMGIYMSGTPQNSTDGKYMTLWARDLLVSKNLNCNGNIKADNYFITNRGLKLWCDYDSLNDFEGNVVDYRLSSPYSTSTSSKVAVDTDIHAGGIKITKESDSTSVIYRFPKRETSSTVLDYTLATTKDIEEQIANLVGSAPESLNTLKELANAIEDNQEIIATLNSAIGSKQNTITGAATTVVSSNLTANRVVVSNTSGKIATSDITSTELNYLDGVTSNIQTQLNGKALSSHSHTNIQSRGSVTEETGSDRPAVSGLSMSEACYNGYPHKFGNVINLRGIGDGQILVGWSGTDGYHAPVYVRSRRNQDSSPWSEWAKVYTSAYKPTLSDLGLSIATQTAQGLMSAADKEKLDGIAIGATNNTGNITGVTAGNGLTGGGSSGSVTLNIGAGSGITVAADTVSVNTNYTTSGKNYKVAVDSSSGGLYVNVPWTDNSTDTKVKQSLSSTNAQYPLLASENTAPTNGTAAATIYSKVSGKEITMNPSVGSITAAAFYQTSDINKKNIHGNINLSIEDILSIPTIEFNYKEDDKTHIGTIAQEVEKVCPEIVQTDNEGFKSVDYAKLSVLAIKALKDTHKELSSLKEEVEQIKALLHGKV